MTTSTASAGAARPRSAGRAALFSGLGLAAIALIGYLGLVRGGKLPWPWYLPCATTLAAISIAASISQRRTVWRIAAIVLVVLLAGAEWMFVLGTRLPTYAGPVAVGRPFPEFESLRADGAPFSVRDLEGDQNSILVFFRGRW